MRSSTAFHLIDGNNTDDWSSKAKISAFSTNSSIGKLVSPRK